MSQKKAILSRRNFLLTAGAGGVAAAAAMVAQSPKGIPQQKNPDKRATRGYQVTEHVNNYYRTAKV